jgi:hypothetical protein
MRCLQCGMPLSPKRSQCPRCGADIPGRIDATASPAKRENQQQPFFAPAQQPFSALTQQPFPEPDQQPFPAPIQQEPFPWPNSNMNIGNGWDGANNAPAPQAPFPVPQAPFPIPQEPLPPIPQQEPFPWPDTSTGNGWDDANNAPMPGQEPYAEAAAPYLGNEQAYFPQNIGHEQNSAWNSSEQGFYQQSGRMNSSPLSNSPKGFNLFAPRVGFSVASTCIAAGTMILLLVFALTKTLPPTTPTQTPGTAHTSIAPTPTTEPTIAPSPTPSPTTGDQQYFSEAQLGSEINNSTAQIVTQSTTFQLHQRIYVTFLVHTGNQIGAACLLWHWGNNSQTEFQFQLLASSGSAYSYMPAEAAGTGKVEIYYASTTACSDEILAQTVDFNISQ